MTKRRPHTDYVPCPECKWEPPVRLEPGTGIPIHNTRTTTHYSDCPKVQLFTPQERRDLYDRLAEMDRVRRRVAALARNYVIG